MSTIESILKIRNKTEINIRLSLNLYTVKNYDCEILRCTAVCFLPQHEIQRKSTGKGPVTGPVWPRGFQEV
jgi:hypothetical protein